MTNKKTQTSLRRVMAGASTRTGLGTSIAEAGAALTLLLPLMMLVLFIILESSYAYVIKDGMNEGARRAARDLSIAYGLDPTIASSRAEQDVEVFDKIRMHNLVTSSEQFSNPVWDLTSSPPTVSVTTTYYGDGRYELPVFPNPDPLQLGSHFTISATAVYRLE